MESASLGQLILTGVPGKEIDPATAARLDFELRSRKSILDLVRGNTDRLLPRLGTADRVRMQLHLDEVRELERKVDALTIAPTVSCVKPSDPGADPQVGGNQPQGGYSQNLGYSNEEQRALTFCNLIKMAYTCDLTRSVSLQMSMFQSHMNMYPLTQQANDLHELGHCGVPGGTKAVAKAQAWHVKHFANLIAMLRDTKEADGSSLLDHTGAVFITEGGHGYDPGGKKANSSHSTENMVFMIAGRAGGMKQGRHIVATGKHPGSVILSAMKATGYTGNSFGQVTGTIPELFL